MTGLADQVKVPRLAVRMLETEPALAEINLAGDTGVDHPLQRSVDGGAADSLVFAPDQIDQVVGAQVSLLAEEDVDDLFALARAFAAVWLQPAEIRKSAVHRYPATLRLRGADVLPRHSRVAATAGQVRGA